MASIPGPRGPIPFERDGWGYPSLRARDLLDDTFALGWLHAVDRLVQVRINLALAQGRCLEILGEGTLQRSVDRAARLFDFAGDAEEQVRKMRPATRELLESYSAGFEAGTAKRGWPLALRFLGIERTPFTPASTVALYRLMAFFGLTSIQQIGVSIVGELAAAGAPKRAFELLLGEGALDLERAGLPRMEWPAELSFLAAPRGSNAFAVSGARSATGGALLMTEPHMEVGSFPPLLYAAHVEHQDGGFRQGLGAAGNPFIMFGRTRHVAWGYTYAHGDQVNVLIEHCRDGQYLAGGEWRPFRKRVEKVRVRGRKEPEEWVYSENDFGTVLGDASGEADRPAARWSGLKEVWQDCDAGSDIMAARTVADMQEINRRIRGLSLHAVLADAAGAVGYVQTGQIDERPPGWSGGIPFPAGKLESRAMTPRIEARRPRVDAPRDGFIASANETRNGPDGSVWQTYPEPPYRFQRLSGLLGGDAKLDLAALATISYDAVDLCAQRLLATWAPLLPADAEAQALIAWGAHQPAAGDAQFHQMALFQRLHREVMAELLGRLIGPERGRRLFLEMIGDVCYQSRLDDALALEKPERLGADELRAVLAAAWARVRGRPPETHGPVPLREKFKNLITQGKIPLLGFDSPELLIPGGPTAIFQSRRVQIQGAELVVAPVCHYLTDMRSSGGWYNVAGGASERRFGPGYGKSLAEWRTGRFLPLGEPSGEAPTAGASAAEP